MFVADDDEDAAAASEHSSLFVADLSGVSQATAAFADVLRANLKSTVQRNRAEVFDGHARGGSRSIEETVHFGHGFVEDSGDHAAVAVSGRTGVAFAETEAADELFGGLVEREFQAHTGGVVASATETEVLFARRT